MTTNRPVDARLVATSDAYQIADNVCSQVFRILGLSVADHQLVVRDTPDLATAGLLQVASLLESAGRSSGANRVRELARILEDEARYTTNPIADLPITLPRSELRRRDMHGGL